MAWPCFYRSLHKVQLQWTEPLQAFTELLKLCSLMSSSDSSDGVETPLKKAIEDSAQEFAREIPFELLANLVRFQEDRIQELLLVTELKKIESDLLIMSSAGSSDTEVEPPKKKARIEDSAQEFADEIPFELVMAENYPELQPGNLIKTKVYRAMEFYIAIRMPAPTNKQTRLTDIDPERKQIDKSASSETKKQAKQTISTNMSKSVRRHTTVAMAGAAWKSLLEEDKRFISGACCKHNVKVRAASSVYTANL